jgi:signal transduction histidine kinase
MSDLASIDRLGRRGRGRLRLRARLALWLFALTALSTAAVALAAVLLVESALERDLEQRLERLAGDSQQALARRGWIVVRRVFDLEQTLRGAESDLLVKLLRRPGDPEIYGAAERMKRWVGLDHLEIVDNEGTVLSAEPWAERAGQPAADLLELEPRVARVELVDHPYGKSVVARARQVVTVGSLEVSLIGGLVLDAATFLDNFGRGAAAFLDANGRPLAVSGGDGEASPWVGPAADAATPTRWLTREPELADRARDVRLMVAVDRGPLRDLIGRLRLSFLLLGGGGALLAALAGLWIAGTITRPVSRLIHSVDAIARGEADYTFPVSSGHELDELVESFSRLHRSLAEQQSRALAAERVAAWREAARRVAHEIKNPLVPIRLTVENLVRARARAPEQFDGLFEEGSRTILEEVAQLQRLVGEFSEFARLPRPQPLDTPLEPLVQSVLSLLGAEERVEVVRSGDPLPSASVDPGQISRALKNVLQNAIEASPREGDAAAVVAVETSVGPDAIDIRVADRGPGFPPDTIGRVFEPYFTTKSGGTGLGMAIAQRILTEHGGTIEVRNRNGGGAVVTLSFPPAFRHPPAAAAGGGSA